MADAGALAGHQEMPYPELAEPVARGITQTNIPDSEADLFGVDITFYQEDEEIPEVGPAPHAGAIEVSVRKDVTCHFLRIFGYESITVERDAVAAKDITGTCIMPMWIQQDTPVEYDPPGPTELLMADGPRTGIPGNFGFLSPNGGVSFADALRGTVTPEEAELARTWVGDDVYAEPGLKVGIWNNCLVKKADSRMERGTRGVYAGDTYDIHRADNPRIMLVAMVEYVDGRGAGAHFKVHELAAFWLDGVVTGGKDKNILGRFMDYTTPGGTGYGVKSAQLIR